LPGEERMGGGDEGGSASAEKLASIHVKDTISLLGGKKDDAATDTQRKARRGICRARRW
jgi:hypothetical protein